MLLGLVLMVTLVAIANREICGGPGHLQQNALKLILNFLLIHINLIYEFYQSISHCFSNYANFKGRASRSEFWWFNLFVLGLEFGADLWDASLGSTGSYGVMGILVLLGTTVPVIAVAARRLHDLNKSGWWQLIAITIIGLIPLIIWWATEGSKKNNPYGKPIKIKK